MATCDQNPIPDDEWRNLIFVPAMHATEKISAFGTGGDSFPKLDQRRTGTPGHYEHQSSDTIWADVEGRQQSLVRPIRFRPRIDLIDEADTMPCHTLEVLQGGRELRIAKFGQIQLDVPNVPL